MGDVIDLGEARRSREAALTQSAPVNRHPTGAEKRKLTMQRQREQLQSLRQQAGVFDTVDWTNREKIRELRMQASIVSRMSRDMSQYLDEMPIDLEEVQQLIADCRKMKTTAKRLLREVISNQRRGRA